MPLDNPRRRHLIRLLAAGLGSAWLPPASAQIFGRRPGRLPPERSVYELSGEVRVNGSLATYETRIKPDDQIRTGPGAHLVAVVGADAFVLRENSTLELALRGEASAGRAVRGFFRLVTGALLTVFDRRDQPVDLLTPVATIGIRGTGVYAEAGPAQSYVCTCYGRTELAAVDDPAVRELLETRHHDAPRWVRRDASGRTRIEPAPFINHTDLELMTLEALVGREVPFAVADDPYAGPRRDY